MGWSSLVKWQSPLGKLNNIKAIQTHWETNNNAVLPHDLNAAPARPSHANNIEALQAEAIAELEAYNLEEGQEHVAEWGLDEEENANPNPWIKLEWKVGYVLNSSAIMVAANLIVFSPTARVDV